MSAELVPAFSFRLRVVRGPGLSEAEQRRGASITHIRALFAEQKELRSNRPTASVAEVIRIDEARIRLRGALP
jgi:hypothetical protein